MAERLATLPGPMALEPLERLAVPQLGEKLLVRSAYVPPIGPLRLDHRASISIA